jgi:hypothetical protein
LLHPLLLWQFSRTAWAGKLVIVFSVQQFARVLYSMTLLTLSKKCALHAISTSSQLSFV